MIARVAESCFWLHRYVERLDNTARMLAVNHAYLLDVAPSVIDRWRPLLVVAGADEDFIARHGAGALEDGEVVQHYLVWAQDNPASAYNSLRHARENARTIRETLSLEAWTAVNRFWLWMNDPESRRLYESERHAFYERIREGCQLFHGVCGDTLLHDEPFEFMRLGMFLERAGQTARILDTRHHAIGRTRGREEGTLDAAEWIAILRSCSAYEPFFKRGYGVLEGRAVAQFLLLEADFPRAVVHCVLRAWNFLQLIRGNRPDGPGHRSATLLVGLVTALRSPTIDDILAAGLHGQLTYVVERLAEVCSAIEADFFTGGMPATAQAAGPLVAQERKTG